MIAVRRRRIIIILFTLAILSIALGLILYALRQNISLFYTPTQAVTGEAPQKKVIRMGGMVEKGSITRSKKGLDIQFNITDLKQTITVTYTGILPDLFREGQGVVAEGQLLNHHLFQASQVLAKHDANYMPPEVKASLAQNNVQHKRDDIPSKFEKKNEENFLEAS